MEPVPAPNSATLKRRHVLMKAKASCGAIFLLGIALTGCRSSPPGETGLQYAYSWNEDRPQESALLQRFTHETGIPIMKIPVPEASREYVDLVRKLLKDGSGPDLFNIDLIWTPVLDKDLLDLRPYMAAEIAQLDPQLSRDYELTEKLVAVPFNVPLGGLEYRADLLREYGYSHPPGTWDELESMAMRIQTGERAKGKKDFWGWVWQGNAAESLTCNALEWQASEGGGRIIEPNRTISVNNPAAIGAWERARHWIGWISPPSVTSYRENDTALIFDSGRAAFARTWILTPIGREGQARHIGWRNLPPVLETGLARLPGGTEGAAATLGGTGTAISSHSTHREEAIALLRFQLRSLIQEGEQAGREKSPIGVKASDPPTILPSTILDSQVPLEPKKLPASFIVSRPSMEAGTAYKAVSQAYSDTVHSVLTGQKSAPVAAAQLEKQLMAITGFRSGPPKTTDGKR
jgi:trehalose/maltose transport system substrate-binding protein